MYTMHISVLSIGSVKMTGRSSGMLAHLLSMLGRISWSSHFPRLRRLSRLLEHLSRRSRTRRGHGLRFPETGGPLGWARVVRHVPQVPPEEPLAQQRSVKPFWRSAQVGGGTTQLKAPVCGVPTMLPYSLGLDSGLSCFGGGGTTD